MDRWLYGSVDGWMHEQMNEWRVEGWMYECRSDGFMDEWMNKTNEWKGG